MMTTQTESWMEFRGLLGEVYDGTESDLELRESPSRLSDQRPQGEVPSRLSDQRPQGEVPSRLSDQRPQGPQSGDASATALQAVEADDEPVREPPPLDLSLLSSEQLDELANALVPHADGHRSVWANRKITEEWRDMAERGAGATGEPAA